MVLQTVLYRALFFSSYISFLLPMVVILGADGVHN